MFVVNDDLSIYATRGDVVFFAVAANNEHGEPYIFRAGDLVRIKVYGKKDAENVVLQKDIPITGNLESVAIILTEEDTKIGEVISKPTDYWYEVELNPHTNPQTIIGYDEDGAKIFKLFPEGDDIPEYEPEPEDIPVVDEELNGASTRPVQNRAIVGAINTITGAFNDAKKEFAKQAATFIDKVYNTDAALAAERARIDNLVSGATADNAEVLDIRVGADGKNYGSAGSAVREQIVGVHGEIDGLKETIDINYTIGSITNGVETDHAHRARFAEKIRACRAAVSMPASSVYLYGYSTYDANGVHDGVDHGWKAMDGAPLHIDSGYFRMNFRRVDDAAITDNDLATLKSNIIVKQFNLPFDMEDVKMQLIEGSELVLPYSVELGSLTEGEKVPFTNRARFADMVKVSQKTSITIAKQDMYSYGWCFYDESGIFDGVDHGWNACDTETVVTFDRAGYVMFNFKRNDLADISADDMAVFADIMVIKTRMTVIDIHEEVKAIETNNAGGDIYSSIGVEYGRYNGASYAFVRIPKITNTGGKLKPVLHFTSIDGSIDGSKASALTYAKRNKAVFTLNAGLFNTGTLLPVGQTIINGVSYVNTPMVDDMGSPISDVECYPLCIDADGNLSAPYSRSVDTADMIADGVVHAVTGWGKVIDNFKACADTVENEIVHAETYIRQVIGQFQNGDYFVCTVDKTKGNITNEAGLTYKDLAQLLESKGVKFAYSLDGGGSAETVIGERQLNPIYEGIVGRAVPTVITFE